MRNTLVEKELLGCEIQVAFFVFKVGSINYVEAQKRPG